MAYRERRVVRGALRLSRPAAATGVSGRNCIRIAVANVLPLVGDSRGARCLLLLSARPTICLRRLELGGYAAQDCTYWFKSSLMLALRHAQQRGGVHVQEVGQVAQEFENAHHG